MSSIVLSGGAPMSAKSRARDVPQCDQYTSWRSRTGPPNSSYTGTPSALALMSHNASSMPAIAFAAMPPALWRAMRYMSWYRISTGRGSFPTRIAAKSPTVATTPYGLRPSEHSP